MPAELRERQGWAQATPLLFVETPRGVLLLTRTQLRDLISEGLAGGSLADELIAERRVEATREDAA